MPRSSRGVGISQAKRHAAGDAGGAARGTADHPLEQKGLTRLTGGTRAGQGMGHRSSPASRGQTEPTLPALTQLCHSQVEPREADMDPHRPARGHAAYPWWPLVALPHHGRTRTVTKKETGTSATWPSPKHGKGEQMESPCWVAPLRQILRRQVTGTESGWADAGTGWGGRTVGKRFGESNCPA